MRRGDIDYLSRRSCRLLSNTPVTLAASPFEFFWEALDARKSPKAK